MNEPAAKDEHRLLQTNLKMLRLPTIGAEFEKLSREAAAENQTYGQYLLQLTELELARAFRVNSHGLPINMISAWRLIMRCTNPKKITCFLGLWLYRTASHVQA